LDSVALQPDGAIWVAGFTTSEDWVEWAGVGGAYNGYAPGETNSILRGLGDGILLRLGTLPVPELQLLSRADGTLEISWPAVLPPEYQLQGVWGMDWTNVTIVNQGGKLVYQTNRVTNTYTTNIVVTNVVGGMTNVTTNTYVTNIVSTNRSPYYLLGGTNIWITNHPAPPPEDYYEVAFSNVGGTYRLLTNIQTIQVNGQNVKVTNVVEAVVGGTNYYVTNFVETPWTNAPGVPIVEEERRRVTVTNDGAPGYFRLRLTP
jgi:hypothetical protein